MIRQTQQEHTSTKVNVELFGVYYSPTLKSTAVKSFNTPFHIVTETTNLDELYDDLFKTLSTKADELPERDSGKLDISILLLMLCFK